VCGECFSHAFTPHVWTTVLLMPFSAAYLSLAAAALPVITVGDFNARAGVFGDDIATSRGSRLAYFCVFRRSPPRPNKGGFLDLIIPPTTHPPPQRRAWWRAPIIARFWRISTPPLTSVLDLDHERIYPQQLNEVEFLRTLETGLGQIGDAKWQRATSAPRRPRCHRRHRPRSPS
jgi:hypothetical protein